LSHLLQGVLADRGQKRREHHPVLVARSACAKRVAQKRKRRVLCRITPICVLAIHDPGFVGMQPQPDLYHPVFDRCAHLLSVLLAGAVHDGVVRETFERDVREVPGHPRIERIMQKQVR